MNAIGDGDEATATVTLVQSGPLLRAWLSRFGRTVATHVTDTVGERMRNTAAPSSYVTVGGYRLPLGTRGADPAEPRSGPAVAGEETETGNHRGRGAPVLGDGVGLGSGAERDRAGPR